MRINPSLIGVLMFFCVSSAVDAAANSRPSPTLPVPSHSADVFRCAIKGCAMPGEGSYPHIIIGIFQTAATRKQSERLFHDMRQQQLWPLLPTDASEFYAAVQPVAIRLNDGKLLAVLISQEEAHVAPSQPGDLVRYSPHFGAHEIPPADLNERAYWSVDGCVAVLCRAKDKACLKTYAQGVFRHGDGVQISTTSFNPMAHGRVIDPQSMLPRTETRVSP